MNTNPNVTRRTLSVLVENAAGVLSQVSRLFSRKGYNIESLAVAPPTTRRSPASPSRSWPTPPWWSRS